MILDYCVILHLEHLPNLVCLCEMCQDIFRYSKFYSVTMMLSELASPCFEEIVEKCRCDLRQQIFRSYNGLVSLFSFVCVVVFVLCCVCVFLFYTHKPSYYRFWLPDINKD